MDKVAQSLTAVKTLERAGFQIRGWRANCAYCKGSSRLTVAFTSSVWRCHRCLKGGSIRALASSQGVNLPAKGTGLSKIKKEKFKAWLSAEATGLADEERLAFKKKKRIDMALRRGYAIDKVWNFFEWFYEREKVWNSFWELYVDRIGRKQLYKIWRCHLGRERNYGKRIKATGD